ncbi:MULTISPECIES: hypothetical protein [unclassified Bacillus (in: firmicutes)]|uniref:hypothetical protein n=1 Tax=unclassified Bacillus (in: firmicutes) TaxID=185979 RepID=UPI0030103DE0
MSNLKINEENGMYIVSDVTDGGYVNRACYHSYQKWETVWNSELELKNIYLDKECVNKILIDKRKEDLDYNKIIRARGRHLRALKEYLGISKKKVDTPKKFFLLGSHLLSSNSGISEKEFIEKEEILIEANGGRSPLRLKKRITTHTAVTEEKKKLVEEYNQRLQEFRAYHQEMIHKIFKENK